MPVKTKTPRTRIRYLVGLAELADHFECSTRTIQNWVSRKEMPAPFRVGRRVLKWDVELLNEWIQDGCPPVED